MNTLIILFSFLLGSIVGSFINAYSFRYKTGLSMMDRSRCFTCNTTIAWFDLLPAGISFLLLKGRCRYCKSSISLQYPIVEVFLGVIFAGIVHIYGLTLESLLFGVLFSILLFIGIYDMRHKIIPDAFVYTFVLLSVLSGFIVGNTIHHVFFMMSSLYTGIGLFLFFGALWFFSRGRWMGFGDAKLALGMGIFLGLSGGISAVILGFWIGALVGVLLLVFQRLKGVHSIHGKTEMPFAPFLLLGLMIVFFFDVNVLTLAI